jgi:hypothetical protein
MKLSRLTTLFITLIALCGVALLSLDSATQAQGGNLLTNPGFDGPYTAFIPQTPEQHASCPAGICGTAQMPAGWTPFWIGQTPEDEWWENKMPEYKAVCHTSPCPFMNRVKGGEQALQYFNFEGTNTAGVWQRVTVPANSRLTFSAWGMAWSSDQDEPVSIGPTSVNMRVGIDPVGGNSPFSASVVWSAPTNPYDAYSLFEVQATAQGDTVTVFLLAQPAEMRKHNDFYWDEASLVVGATAAAAPSGNSGSSGGSAPAAALGPTPTPNAEGLILVTVQPGDTMWAIAARAGLTLDEFLALNPGLTNQTFIQAGEQYIIGQVTTTTAAPEPTATITNTENSEATEPEPTIEPTLEPSPEPTAEPALVSAGGTICLLAFADMNQDGVLNEAESLQEGVFITISAEETVVSNYLTDGVSEPYCIAGLPAGDYRVSRSLAASEVASNGADQEITLTEGAQLDLDFGGYVVETAKAAAPAEEEVAMTANEDAAATSADLGELAETTVEESEAGSWLPLVLIGLAAAVFLLMAVILVILRARRA